MSYVLSGLEPKGFFKWFEEITRIPHGSGHEEKLAEFLVNFAKERNLECVQDEIGNVLIRVPASAGYENEPSILLQGHMDMVLAKDSTATIDLKKDPLEICVNGNEITAKGTTLGADDGVAIATMLAIADDDTIAHPKLEFLCTVQEELGLVGIINADLSPIKSRRMINLDSGGSHEVCISSVGAKIIAFEKKFDSCKKEGLKQLYLRITGGVGGHAGLFCHKNRACAINIIGEMLCLLSREMPVYISEIIAEGPAIHGFVDVCASIPEECAVKAESILRERFELIKGRYKKSDPNLVFEVLDPCEEKSVLSAEDSLNIIRSMFFLHTGVRKSDTDETDIIITSTTFHALSLNGGEFKGKYMIRSLDDSVRELWYDRTEEIMGMLGFELTVPHVYTSWPGSSSFVMQERFVKEHLRLFGENIVIKRLHASIEANVIFQHFPDMDAVGIQPTAVNIHTPSETLFIDQVQEFWQLLIAVLKLKD